MNILQLVTVIFPVDSNSARGVVICPRILCFVYRGFYLTRSPTDPCNIQAD